MGKLLQFGKSKKNYKLPVRGKGKANELIHSKLADAKAKAMAQALMDNLSEADKEAIRQDLEKDNEG